MNAFRSLHANRMRRCAVPGGTAPKGSTTQMSDGDAGLSELEPKRTPVLAARPHASCSAPCVLVAAVAGIYTWSQVKPVVESRKYASITYEVPEGAEAHRRPRARPSTASTPPSPRSPTRCRRSSPARTPAPPRAPPTASPATSPSNPDDLGASRVGPIVVNLEQLHSDNNLRDARLRLDYLESHEYPLATFKVDRGLGPRAARSPRARPQDFTMTGDAHRQGRSRKPVTFDGTATLDDGALDGHGHHHGQAVGLRRRPHPHRRHGLHLRRRRRSRWSSPRYDPTERTIPTTITGPDAKEPEDAPSFAKTVQPILEANCVSCHNTGQMGAHALTIDTAGDAQSVSDGLKTVTAAQAHAAVAGVRRRRPARPQDGADPTAEIAAIGAWSDAGGALDVPADHADQAAPRTPRARCPARTSCSTAPPTPGRWRTRTTTAASCSTRSSPSPPTSPATRSSPTRSRSCTTPRCSTSAPSRWRRSKAVDGKDGQPGWGCYSGPSLRGERPDTVPGRAPTPRRRLLRPVQPGGRLGAGPGPVGLRRGLRRS